jgi:single-stranded-DNA-specific exonuclease
VIGIVASRLVERFHRPVVLIAGTDGDWKGSGRSVGAFDLHAGLAACAEHLERFGGHRAAAGLSIAPGRVEGFADAFASYADAALTDDDLRSVTVVDAVVPGTSLTLGLCAELERLAPFGLGNPAPTLLVAGCEVAEPAAVGDGRHLRFRIRDGGRQLGTAIAFGLGSQLDRFRRVGRYDVAFRLQENRWNGTVAPQLVVRRVFDTPERYLALRERFATEWRTKEVSPDGEAIFEELGYAEGVGWRSLLESERFRALLEQEPLARAA